MILRERFKITDFATRRITLWLLIVIFIITIGLAWQVTARNRDIDRVEAATKDISQTVHELEDFVNELKQPPTEDEVALNEAISRAVSEVPQIREILCQAFPEVPACRSGL